jgi:nicotinamide-nucleotide amidase
VEELLGDLVHSTAPTVATYAKRDGIHVRLTTKAASPTEAETVIAPMEARIRDLLGLAVYGVDEETLAQGTVRLLDAQGLTLAIVESGTAGTITAELAAALPPARFAGSRVLPEVDRDAAQAEALAAEARASGRADVGLGVAIERTRVEPPAFTVHVAIESDKGKRTAERAFNAALEQVRQRAVNEALNLLRSALT